MQNLKLMSSHLRKIHLVLIMTAAVITTLFAQPEQDLPPLSLQDAIAIGLENNYQIQIADRNLEIARNNNDPGVAGAYPNVDLSLNVNNGYTNLNQPASFLQTLSQGNNSIVPGVAASWVLYDGSRVNLTKLQLEELESRSEGQARIVVENTIEAITLAYYQALLRREALQVVEEVLDLSRDRINYQEVRREFGQASTFDVLQDVDAFLNDSTSYLSQLNLYDNAQRTLNLTMGVDELSRRYRLTDDLSYGQEVYTLETLRNQLLANNNQLNNLFVDRELAALNTRLAESTRLPSVIMNTGLTYNLSNTLFGTGTFISGEERDLGGIQNKTFNAFLNFGVSYNLFNGGVRKRNIQNAKLEEINAQIGIDDLKRNLMAQLENTYATYVNQKQLIEVTQDLVANARRNIEIGEERFRGGLINSFDYRVIQLNYINANQSLLQAIFDLKLTETELQRLVGGLAR